MRETVTLECKIMTAKTTTVRTLYFHVVLNGAIFRQILILFLIFFLARERAEFNKSSNLIGSWSGRNFLIRSATAGGIHRVDLFS